MKHLDKTRVAVLYGGRSSEHEVSLQSAANVIQYIDRSRYEVIPIGIDKQGTWFLGEDIFTQSLAYKKVAAVADGHQKWFTPEWIGKSIETKQLQEVMARAPLDRPFDVVFPVVHGALCEDGTLQGLLELADIPYVGCRVLASAIGMDKDVSKRLAIQAGINVAPYLVIKQASWRQNADAYVQRISQQLSYPVFVKPANTGSSVGVEKVKTAADLVSAMNNAFRYDSKVLVEKAISAVELEVAVLEALDFADPIVSVVGEIRPSHEFYSYEAKYLDEKGAESFIPAPITELLKEEAQQLAKKIFLLLECEGMARVDLFLDKETQQIYFNEINTIPGFTQISMYPKLMDASGVSYPALLTHLIELALQRHNNKSQLTRNYLE
jgi:D-alanine-D-alanine ligase